MATTTLYRPVGQREYELIKESGFRAFPPRLPEQPFFYPVANEEYAVQIARDWNVRDAASDFLERYPARVVGERVHTEYWIPAEELGEFNARFGSSIPDGD